MKTGFTQVVLSALVFTLAAGSGVFAAETRPPSVTPVKPTKLSPSALTGAECKGLGGKLAANTACASGAECLTTDKDSVVHRACLTKM